MSSDMILAVSAAVQAVTAVAIGLLTWRLVRASNRTVAQSEAMAIEAKRTNDLTSEALQRELRRLAGVLRVQKDGRSHTDGRPWELKYQVENVGDGAAHSIAIHFEEWDSAVVPIPLRAGEKAFATLKLPADTPKAEAIHPDVTMATFQSSDGNWWEQTPYPHSLELRPPRLLQEDG
jgi:hypothetical protein